MKRVTLLVYSLFFVLLGPAYNALAEVPLTGYFIAGEQCAAYKSFRKGTNPGNIYVKEDTAYEVVAKNKTDATHYRILVKNASPVKRWVQASCGILLVDCRKSSSGEITQPVPGPESSSGHDYLLALSWQPAFCQNHQSKKECKTMTETRYDASHFTLHGLWPQPKSNIYCNVTSHEKNLDKRKMWEQLSVLGLSKETYDNLTVVMPGVASYLHRHEWIKHGTCYSQTPEEYFKESILLTEQINASGVRDFFVENIGKNISMGEIKSRFNKAFGNGAGKKVKVKCNQGMITELWINLKGDINEDSLLKDLLKNASNTSSSCSGGVVDPVGY